MELWNNDIEIEFFKQALKNFASVEQLFYKLEDGIFAYIPKKSKSNGTLQARNSLIGKFTEKWCKNLIEPIARKHNLFAVNGVICEEIGLTKQSSADLAICKTDSIIQKPEDIRLIFEIKMSIVSNYQYINDNNIKWSSDYKSHKGNPSLLRSDSMLKAIGKSISIRVAGEKTRTIPIVVLGNSPITEYYSGKVDYLKKTGVIQNFISLNPNPTNAEHISNSPNYAFVTISNYSELENILNDLLNLNFFYFSAMKNKTDLGKIITLSAKEKTDLDKADKFLELINA